IDVLDVEEAAYNAAASEVVTQMTKRLNKSDRCVMVVAAGASLNRWYELMGGRIRQRQQDASSTLRDMSKVHIYLLDDPGDRPNATGNLSHGGPAAIIHKDWGVPEENIHPMNGQHRTIDIAVLPFRDYGSADLKTIKRARMIIQLAGAGKEETKV